MAADKKPAAKPKAGVAKKKGGTKLHQLYTITSDKIARKNKTCPKCGPGMFMGNHKNRVVCGKCNYTEFVKN